MNFPLSFNVQIERNDTAKHYYCSYCIHVAWHVGFIYTCQTMCQLIFIRPCFNHYYLQTVSRAVSDVTVALLDSHIFPECDLDTSICTIIRIGGWFSHAIDLAKHLLLMRDVHQFFCFLFMLAYCLRMHCRPHHTYSCWFFFYRYYINSA